MGKMSMSPEFYHQPNNHARVTIKETHLDIFTTPVLFLEKKKKLKVHSSNVNEFIKEEGMNKTNSGN